MILAEEDILPWILDKFARHGWWNEKHTNYDNVPKGAPPHIRNIPSQVKNLARSILVHLLNLR